MRALYCVSSIIVQAVETHGADKAFPDLAYDL